MKKTVNKLLVCLLAGMMCIGSAACGGGTTGGTQNSGSDVNEPIAGVTNPYKMSVYSFTGGYGEEWLNALAARYRKARAGKEFTINGVTYDGVDFSFAKEKETMSSMKNSGNHYDVWFQEQVYYNELVEDDIFHDMTDVLTSDNPYESGKTLESKMSEYQKEYYKRDTDGDGVKDTYYGIPHYAGYVGIAYNKAMFEKYNWYFKKDYTANEFAALECFAEAAGDVKSAGPDGVENTDDDGLPTTYDEFFALCEVIKEKCKPISWTGKHKQSYINWFLTALTANYEGLDQMLLNYSFNGTAKNLIEVDVNGQITELEDVMIHSENGYELAKQAGKYYALKFVKTILENDYQTPGSIGTTYEQTTAQEDFVSSDGTKATHNAMLVDGVWWEMEAKQTFDTLKDMTGVDYRDEFAWLPLPMPTQAGADDRAQKLSTGKNGYVLTDTHNSLAFIDATVSDDVYALAKDFIQFAYTDESLAEFSIITDTTKALSYTMTAEQKAQMSAFGRSLMDMQEKSDIVYTFSQSAFYQANEASFSEYNNTFASKYTADSQSVNVVVDELRMETAETYFSGLYLYNKDVKWPAFVKGN